MPPRTRLLASVKPLRTAFSPIALSIAMLFAAIAANGQTPSSEATTPVQIRVDLARPLGPAEPIYSWFGYDEGNYTTTPHGRALLGELHDLSPVPVTVRVHHLLTSGDGTPELKWSSTGVYTEDAAGKPSYHFEILDGIFDTFKAAGIRPMVELGFMPKDLTATLPDRPNQPYQVHFPAGDVLSGSSNNPPRDYAKWGELARAVTAHLVSRYGADTVRGWYFEVWNEPDIPYWHGSREDYFKLYDFAVAGVRVALPDAKVGGPATTSPRNGNAHAFLQAFLQHVDTGKSAATGGPVPLDFISFHAKGQPTFAGGNVTMGMNRELTDVDRGFALVASFPRFQRLPIILSEADPEGCAACSAKTNPSNNYRNGTLYPAYTAAAYKRLLDLNDRYKTNLISMLSWSFEFEGRDYFEGFRSLATNGVDKPVLNLFRMLGLMTGARVSATSSAEIPLATMLSTGVRAAPDVDALATATDGKASVLVWNYHDVAGPAAPARAIVHIADLPPSVHRAQLTQLRLDDSHSNAYTTWQAMGSPPTPTPSQLDELKRSGQLQMLTSPVWIEVVNGLAIVPADLPRDSVSLLIVSW